MKLSGKVFADEPTDDLVKRLYQVDVIKDTVQYFTAAMDRLGKLKAGNTPSPIEINTPDGFIPFVPFIIEKDVLVMKYSVPLHDKNFKIFEQPEHIDPVTTLKAPDTSIAAPGLKYWAFANKLWTFLKTSVSFLVKKNIFYTDWKPENMGLGPLNPTLRFINKKRDEIQNEDLEGDHVYNVVISKKVNNQEVSSLVNAFSDNASAIFHLLDNEKTLTIKGSEQQRSTDFATGKYENFQTPSQYFNFSGSSEATFHGFKMPRKGQELDYSDMFFKFVMSRNEEASTVNIYDFFKFVMSHDERARIRRKRESSSDEETSPSKRREFNFKDIERITTSILFFNKTM